MKEETVNYKQLAIGVLLFIGILSIFNFEGNFAMKSTFAITVLMAFLWLTEALPIGITSLLPIVLFPVFGVLNGKDVSDAYINYIIFLFLGGFIMALTIQKWGLHKRMALKILAFVGDSFFTLLFGFMFCAAFLSMWISNTAAAMMTIPIALSVTNVLEKQFGKEEIKKYTTRLYISIAYACSIGGVATLVGTPPNLSFVRISEILFPNIPEIGFAQWMLLTFPLVIALFFTVLFFLYFTGKPKNTKGVKLEKSFFREQYIALGKTSVAQKRVFIVFVCLVFLWMFRTELVLGSVKIPGWSNLFSNPDYFNDGTVAIFIAAVLFIIPSSEKNKSLATWKITKKIPWNVVFLFGGGFAIAKAFVSSGLSIYLGNQLLHLGNYSDTTILGSIVFFITFLTEFTSNTATTEIMLPVIASVATVIKMNPLILMISVTFAASMAFMFPVATPPNALVFGTGKVKMWDMVKIGFFINLLAIGMIVLLALYWIPYVLQIDIHTLPDWATEITKKH